MPNPNPTGPGFIHCTAETWEEIYNRLDEVKRYRDGVCIGCGENIRMQGNTKCFECLEEEMIWEEEKELEVIA